MGRGMGCATRGGGSVNSGSKNKKVSETSKKTGPIMMSAGGTVLPSQRAPMAKTPAPAPSAPAKVAPTMSLQRPSSVSATLPNTPARTTPVRTVQASTPASTRAPTPIVGSRSARPEVVSAPKKRAYKKGGSVRKMRMGGSCD